MKKTVFSMSAGIALLAAIPFAEAATVQFSAMPTTPFMNPYADSTTGDVRENKTRTWPLHHNPWPTAGNSPSDDPTAYFTSIGRDASATYSFADSGAASFVWGSPDYYNKIEFLLDGIVVDVFQVTPSTILYPAVKAKDPALALITDIAGGIFNGIRFSSPQYSFEFANLTTLPPAPVPLPAGVVLMATALGGFAVARKRQKRAS